MANFCSSGSIASLSLLSLILINFMGSIVCVASEPDVSLGSNENPLLENSVFVKKGKEMDGKPIFQRLCENNRKCMGAVSSTLWTEALKLNQNDRVAIDDFHNAVKEFAKKVSEKADGKLPEGLVLEKFKSFKPFEGHITYSSFQDQLFKMKINVEGSAISFRKFKTEVPALMEVIFKQLGSTCYRNGKQILDKFLGTETKDEKFFKTGALIKRDRKGCEDMSALVKKEQIIMTKSVEFMLDTTTLFFLVGGLLLVMGGIMLGTATGPTVGGVVLSAGIASMSISVFAFACAVVLGLSEVD